MSGRSRSSNFSGNGFSPISCVKKRRKISICSADSVNYSNEKEECQDIPSSPLIGLSSARATSLDFSLQETPASLPRNRSDGNSTAQSLAFAYATEHNEPAEQNHRRLSQLGVTLDWAATGALKSMEFTKTQELLVPAPTDPFDAFRLFLDDDILDLIVRETNLNAIKVQQQPNVTIKSRITSWKDIDRQELMTFIGLLIHSGTIRLNRLSDYWKMHWLFSIPCFRQYMSRNRFMLILRCLHFQAEEVDEDRLAKIRPIMDHFNEKIKNIYYPGKQLSLDETMMLWRGRLLFRQYIKNKRHKYGVKLHVLAEPNGIVQKFLIDAGKADETAEEDHTQKIVMELLEGKLDCGHSVYMDNFYNSYELAILLLDRGTYCTGTLNKKRKGNPTNLINETVNVGENKSVFLNGVNFGKWKDKRQVLYISTEHNNEMIEVASKRGQEKLKPSAIVHFNNYISGVDIQDQLLAYYPCENKTLFWYKKVFIHILQICLNNSFHIYNKYSLMGKMDFYSFRLFILEKMLPQQTAPTKSLKISHKLTKIQNMKTREKKEANRTRIVKEVVRKECKGCRQKNKRMATLYECKGCAGVPGFCTECFCTFHA